MLLMSDTLDKTKKNAFNSFDAFELFVLLFDEGLPDLNFPLS